MPIMQRLWRSYEVDGGRSFSLASRRSLADKGRRIMLRYGSPSPSAAIAGTSYSSSKERNIHSKDNPDSGTPSDLGFPSRKVYNWLSLHR